MFNPTQQPSQPTFQPFNQTNNSANAFKPVQFGQQAPQSTGIPAFNANASTQQLKFGQP
jgi:hypothetical protein